MAVAFDPLSAAAMTDPQPLYAQLRAEDPVHYMPDYDTWALASFDAVWRAASDSGSFSVRRGQMPLQILLGEPATNLTFPELDPPEHRLRRRVLAPAYTREAAQRDDATIRAITRDVLLPLVHDGDFDAFVDYAHVVAGRFAAKKAGVPASDADSLRRDISRSFRREPGQRGTSAANQDAAVAVFSYLHALVADSRRHPKGATGLLATLLDARVDGDPLRDEQIAAELHTLMVTGSDTTELGLAATLFHAARDPAQQRALLADPANAAWAFAEGLRYDHPTDVLGRCVTRDVEIAGRTLRAGQGVLLLWGSANRDEAEFPDAGRFDVHRRPRRTLVFGHGQHQCIGEHIGMRMGAVLVEELVRAVDDYEVRADGVHRRRGEFLKGFDRLPIAVTRRPPEAA
jgi:cytochrome P450